MQADVDFSSTFFIGLATVNVEPLIMFHLVFEQVQRDLHLSLEIVSSRLVSVHHNDFQIFFSMGNFECKRFVSPGIGGRFFGLSFGSLSFAGENYVRIWDCRYVLLAQTCGLDYLDSQLASFHYSILIFFLSQFLFVIKFFVFISLSAVDFDLLLQLRNSFLNLPLCVNIRQDELVSLDGLVVVFVHPFEQLVRQRSIKLFPFLPSI